MKVKIFLISLLCIFCVFFITVFYLTTSEKSELEILRESIEINNIQVNAGKESYKLSYEQILTLNDCVKSYFVSDDLGFLTSFNENNISDIEYFKYIMEVNNTGNSVENIMKSNSFWNYQFYDKDKNCFIDYFYYKGPNLIPATLEIVYLNGVVSESKVY